MEFLPAGFLPADIDTTAAVALIAATFIGNIISAAMGIGGGIILLAVMANLMPVAAIIPVHGVAQLGANIFRGGVQRAHIDWLTFMWFGLGSIVGVAVGGSVAVALPANVLRGALGIFIIYTVWGPQLKFFGEGNLISVVVGAVSSVLTMFFGATGPFAAALLRQRGYTPQGLIGTHSACMGAQHALKIVAFGLLGFAFAEWLGLIAMLLLASLAGTLIGSYALRRMSADVFSTLVKMVLTILAANLLAVAVGLYSIT
ncbi:MAG: sulfite exporter TauE/SafE family protein [Alphaproteobacteria bacterium]